MFIHFHHTHGAAHRFSSEFSQIFLSRSIRALGASIVSIFFPIYLYQLSGSDFSVAIPFITSTYLVIYGVRILGTIYCMNLVNKYGGKHIITLSAVVDSIAYILLGFLDEVPVLIVPTALLLGISSTLFFTAIHQELLASMGKKKTHKVGSVAIVRKLAISVGPLIGGFISGYYGFQYAALVAAFVILCSVIPLHMNYEPLKSKKKIKWHDVAMMYKKQPSVRGNIGMGHNAIAAALIWPLFIYIFLESYQEVGIIISVSLLFSIVFMALVGKNESKKSIKKELKVSSHASALVHVLRSIAYSPFLITVVNILNDIFFSIMVVPYLAQYYRNANKFKKGVYVAAMESAFAIGALLTWVVVLIAFMLTNNIQVALIAGFILGAYGVNSGKNIVSERT